MQKNIQNDEDDKMKTTDNSKVVSEMIKDIISEDELPDIENTNEIQYHIHIIIKNNQK